MKEKILAEKTADLACPTVLWNISPMIACNCLGTDG
jgi:hypothetical protein